MKVIIAIDGSEDAEHAARFFCRLPHDQSLDVTVMTALDPPDVSLSTPSETWYPEFVEHQVHFADQACARVAGFFDGADATVRCTRRQGHPGHCIVQQATEDQADLIVIGAKGHSAIERMLLGSVSYYVATHAHCSVLVVRPPDPQGSAEESVRVTLAYDASESSEAAVEEFTHFGWTGNASVQVLSVLQRFRAYRQDLLPAALEHTAEERAVAREKAEQVVERLKQFKIHAAAQIVSAEHIGEAIVRKSIEDRSSLVVLGDSGRSMLPRLLLGSVSHYVLRHAKHSVWIMRRRKG